MRFVRVTLIAVLGCAGGSLLGPRPGYGDGILRWSKEGTTQADFLRDRYECLRDSQQQDSRFFANAQVAAGRSRQITDSGLFVACMNARGYARDDAGPFAPPADGAVLAH